MKLLIATQNLGKLKEFRGILSSEIECLSLTDVETPEKPIPHVVEDGKTYKNNVTKKAVAYFNQYNTPVVADDSGIEIDALGGEPGVEAAYFGGENISWEERIQFTLDQLSKHPKPWTAKFKCLLCYYDGIQSEYFEGICQGEIIEEPKGKNGFGYDPIFFSPELNFTFGEVDSDQKAKVSHRAKAIEQLRKFIHETKLNTKVRPGDP